MKVLNLFKSRTCLPNQISGCSIKFSSLVMEKEQDKRAKLQAVCAAINRSGFDAAVFQTRDSDIIVLDAEPQQLVRILMKFDNLGPKVEPVSSVPTSAVERAWQNRVRSHILSKGFLKTGDRFVLARDIQDKSSNMKRAYRIQSEIVDSHLSIWIDIRTRIMTPLSESMIAEAVQMAEESEVKVRVLPYWTYGVLVGKKSEKADQLEFPLGESKCKTSDYWRIKHHVDFVDPNEDMLEVFVPLFGNTVSYPKSCVFKEFGQREPLPSNLKKDPGLRINYAGDFVRDTLADLRFIGEKTELEGPTSPSSVGFEELSLPARSQLSVVVGEEAISPVASIHSSLKQHGPFAGMLDGKYIVIHSGNRDEISRALGSLEDTYGELGFGTLQRANTIGEDGFIDTGGETVADYTSAITQLRAQTNQKVLAFIVLPDTYASEIYYRSREKLFERLFGTEPFPAQAIGLETLRKILSSSAAAYGIKVNTASQCYIKFGGTGTAAWILKEPADSAISGITAGCSCYAYHDVSRRPKLKASATAYSAMTDSYGRYVATGTKPIGGEKLTPSGFYDVLIDLLSKIALFGRKFGQVGGRTFSFRRLVFAKDGVIREDEGDMIEKVILNGIPEDRKEPIPSLLSRKETYPKNLIIDVIGVNKSPNKRIVEQTGTSFANVREGTAIAYDENVGLLVSCAAPFGTAQPIEISLKKHLCINCEATPRPHIKQIIDEYYRLTHLNWASIFRQGKFALPQILTQNLGENISAGVMVQDNMVLL
jgi:hypothetical protein